MAHMLGHVSTMSCKLREIRVGGADYAPRVQTIN